MNSNTPTITSVFYLRSTVLGGRTISEYDAMGIRQKAYVYTGEGLLAEQERIVDPFTGGSTTRLFWQHGNPLIGDGLMTDPQGVTLGRITVDPVGVDLGDTDPFVTEGGGGGGVDTGQLGIDAKVAQLIPGFGGLVVKLDGFVTSPRLGFSSLESGGSVIVNSGANTTPRVVQFGGHTVLAVYRAFHDGYQGLIPNNAVYTSNGNFSLVGRPNAAGLRNGGRTRETDFSRLNGTGNNEQFLARSPEFVGMQQKKLIEDDPDVIEGESNTKNCSIQVTFKPGTFYGGNPNMPNGPSIIDYMKTDNFGLGFTVTGRYPMEESARSVTRSIRRIQTALGQSTNGHLVGLQDMESRCLRDLEDRRGETSALIYLIQQVAIVSHGTITQVVSAGESTGTMRSSSKSIEVMIIARQSFTSSNASLAQAIHCIGAVEYGKGEGEEIPFKFSICIVLVLLTVADTLSNNAGQYHRNSSSMFESSSSLGCLSKDEIGLALQNLSSAKTSSEQERIKNSLLENGKRSDVCRNRIIAAIIEGMDQPDVDLVSDRSSFYLWHYGTELLGDLKAVEALDLLIKHLDLNDGTPFPLHHHPAINGITRMGRVAIPKLKDVLTNSADRYMRRYAVFCIASIGGTSARQALEDALRSESDKCVRGFLTASLHAFSNPKVPNQVGADENAKWYSAFLCDGS